MRRRLWRRRLGRVLRPRRIPRWVTAPGECATASTGLDLGYPFYAAVARIENDRDPAAGRAVTGQELDTIELLDRAVRVRLIESVLFDQVRSG